MLKSKIIILWGPKDLLGYSVESVLPSRDEWEVIRISSKNSLEFLIREVEKADSEIVIICQGDSAGKKRLPLQLLQKSARLKVITVSPENNSMDVYKKQKIWIKQTSDLISMVEA